MSKRGKMTMKPRQAVMLVSSRRPPFCSTFLQSLHLHTTTDYCTTFISQLNSHDHIHFWCDVNSFKVAREVQLSWDQTAHHLDHESTYLISLICFRSLQPISKDSDWYLLYYRTAVNMQSREVWDRHGGGYASGMWIWRWPQLGGTNVPISNLKRWSQQVAPKCWYHSTRSHCVSFHKTAIFNRSHVYNFVQYAFLQAKGQYQTQNIPSAQSPYYYF
jgi:hypothetical protein